MSGKIKVGLVTFHNTSNYGAALQAYATFSALKKQGYDAEIIDYSNKYRDKKYSIFFRIIDQLTAGNILQAIKMMVVSPGIYIRNLQFKSFYRHYYKVSKNKYRNSPQAIKDLKDYDVVVAGSDQIWSYKNNNYDYNYLLEFVPDNIRKISYASSFGLTEIPDQLKHKYKTLLSRMDFVSVREKTGVGIVSDLIGKTPYLALDPVLLHTSKFWSDMASEITFKPKSYDLYYMNDISHRNHPIFSNDMNISKFPKISIGSFKISDFFDTTTHIRNHTGPNSFLSYIMNARVVYTTSFHALVFCLIFNVQFYVFLSGDEGRDSRLIQILKTFNLEDRAIFKNKPYELINKSINFSNFNNSWPLLREECKQFLKNSIIEKT